MIELENNIKITLAISLQDSINNVPETNDTITNILTWIAKYPAQIIILTSQILWSQNTENSLTNLNDTINSLEIRLRLLSESVLHDMVIELRKKTEQLLTEMIHQRDVIRLLILNNTNDKTNFGWIYHLRFYWIESEINLNLKLSINMSNASFKYGFEYLGIGERLVQTPLTDRCYLTLTQALHHRMGGNPFGPAVSYLSHLLL